jgi:hypothetical protein
MDMAKGLDGVVLELQQVAKAQAAHIVVMEYILVRILRAYPTSMDGVAQAIFDMEDSEEALRCKNVFSELMDRAAGLTRN